LFELGGTIEAEKVVPLVSESAIPRIGKLSDSRITQDFEPVLVWSSDMNFGLAIAGNIQILSASRAGAIVDVLRIAFTEIAIGKFKCKKD